MPHRTRSRRPAPVVVALGALTVAAVALAVIVVGSPAAATTPGRTVTVKRGVVQSTVSGSGNLAAANQADLDFSTGGEVTHVYVKEGEHVSEGQLLATLDPSSAEVTLAQARADLASAEAQLESASSGTSTTTTASDTSTTPVMLAVAAQATPIPTPTPTPTPAVSATPAPTASATPAPTATASATPAASGGTGGSGSAGGSSGGSGSSSSSGASSATSVAAAQASVDSAELAVTKAKQALADTKLRAPMPGTIAAVSGSVGDSVSGGSSSSSSSSSSTSDASTSSAATSSSSSGFITLAQLHRFKLEVSLSESDIGKVHKGQAATVTVNAVSGLELSGHVSSVGVLSSSSSSSDAVSYPVTIVMDQGTSKARSGMSATADVITDQASGLVVPSQAVRGSTVTLVRNGEHVQTRVTTGVAGDTSTQILSGVSEGDELYVTSTSAAAGASATGSSSTGTNATGQQRSGLGTGAGGFSGGGPPAGGFGGGAAAGGGRP